MKSNSAVKKLLALAIPALIPAAVMAEPLALEAPPASAPVVAQPAPAAVPPVNSQAEVDKILVLPFQPVNPNETKPWIGKSIQQSMVADLMASAPDRITTADQFAVSVEAAIALAKQHDARYVIAGGFVSTDQDLRVTGQLLDAQTGKAVAGLKVTGDPSQIFRMEDGLAMQVKEKLFPGSIQAPPAPTVAQPQAAQQNPDMVNVPQPQSAASATAAAMRDNTGAYAVQAPQYYSSYATASAPVVYGATPAYTYYPSDYGDSYYSYPYSYPYYYPSYGIGLGFYYGGYGGYGNSRGYHHFDGHNRGFVGRGGFTGGGRGSVGFGTASVGHAGGIGGAHAFGGGGGGMHGGGGGHR